MKRTWTTLTITALALAFAAGGAPVAATDGDEEHERRIEIRRLHCDDGEECEDGRKHVIEIDGEELGDLLDGSHEWIGADGAVRALSLMHGAHHQGGFLGVRLTELTPELRTHFGVPSEVGVMVSKVVEESAAERAGIEVGDVISLVEGEGVGSARALSAAIGAHEEGETVTLEVWRDGQVRQISATLDERKGAQVLPRIRMHGGPHGMGHAVKKRIEVRCDDGDDDCDVEMGDLDLDLDCEGEGCEVHVECTGDGCDCTVNGDDVDCAEIGVPHE